MTVKSSASFAYLLAGLSIIAVVVTEIAKGTIPDVISVLAISAVSGALGITVPGATTNVPTATPPVG